MQLPQTKPGRGSVIQSKALPLAYLAVAILVGGMVFYSIQLLDHAQSQSIHRLSDQAKQQVITIEKELVRLKNTAETLASLHFQNYLNNGPERAFDQLLDYLKLNMVGDYAPLKMASIHSSEGHQTTLKFDETGSIMMECESTPFRPAILQLGARWEVGIKNIKYFQPLKGNKDSRGYLELTYSISDLMYGFNKDSNLSPQLKQWWLDLNGNPGFDTKVEFTDQNKSLKKQLRQMMAEFQSGTIETECPWHGDHPAFTAVEPLIIGDYDLGIMVSMDKSKVARPLVRLAVVVSSMFITLLMLILLILKMNASKRKTVQRLLADEQAVNEGIFRSIDDLIFQQDLRGIYTDCNRSFADFFGLTPNSIRGRTDTQLGISDDQVPVSAEDRVLLRRAQSKASELWITGPNGLPELVDLRKHPLKHIDGRVYGIIGIGRVKTEQWHSEQKLIELKEELEEANTNMEEALNRANKFSVEADNANKAKSEFLANMSHEIRTPLGAVIGLTDLIAQTDCSPKQIAYLNKLDNAAHSLLHIINDILDFSKIEAGKMTFEVIPFHLGEIISQVTEMFSERVMSRNLFFINKRENVPELLIGDPVRLRQILVNLLGNSLKFTENGGITLTVGSGERIGGKVYLLFSIQDTGIGIPEDKLGELFSSFSQADTSTTRQFGGTGLGLSICQQLTELMGGNIWVESEVGKGTTFHFTLPFDELDDAASDEFMEKMFQKEELGLTKPGMPLEGLNILLVDDNEINREVISEILAQRGATVTSAENGQDGVKLVESRDFHIVLMDMQMPVMDGPTATRTIRQRYDASELPIVALTANAQAEDKRICLDSGMNDFMVKPLDPAQLVDMILALVKNIVIESQAPISLPVEAPKMKVESPGIDLIEVLNRLGQNKDLLKKLMKMFLDQHGDDIGKIDVSLAEPDRNKAIHQAHALKGTAGNLSLYSVHKEAHDLEHLLRSKDPMPEKTPESLVAAMEEALGTLQAFLDKTSQKPQSHGAQVQAMSPKQAIRLLTDLEILVKNSDVRADDLFNDNKDKMIALIADNHLDGISRALMFFDFAEATKLIAEAKEELKVTNE